MVADDGLELLIEALLYHVGQRVAVDAVGFVHGHAGELVLRVGDHGRMGAVGEGLQHLHLVGDGVGVVHHHLTGPIAQVRELLQHLLGGLEVEGRRIGRVVEAQLVEQDLPIDGVLRLQEMDVAGGHGPFAQLVPQGQDAAVDVVEALGVLHQALPQEEGVVAVGLDLQVVVVGSDLQELFLRLVIEHGPVELPRLASGAQDEAAPEDGKHAPGDQGLAAPHMVQVGKADELVEVLHPRLVPGQDDDVVGLLLLLAEVPVPLCRRIGDHGQGADAHGLQLVGHPHEEHGAGVGVVVRPMVAAHVDAVMGAEGVQLMVLHVVVEDVSGEHEGVCVGQIEADAELLPVMGDEPHVESGVVGHQAGAAAEVAELLQSVPAGGRADEHVLGDAGELGDLLGNDHAVVDEGIEALRHLPIHQADRADLDDVAGFRLQARGLDVEGHVLPLHGEVHGVGLQIPLHPVQGLDAGGFRRLGCLGEGLDVAVVRDGQGLMAPAGRGLEGLGQVRETVHGGHAGVQMELRPLLRGRVLPEDPIHQAAVVDIKVQLGIVLAALANAPQKEILALLPGRLQPEHESKGLPLLEEGGLAVDGIGEVGDVHLDPPAVFALLRLVAPALPDGGGYQAALDDAGLLLLRKIVDGGVPAAGDPVAQQDAVLRQVHLDHVGLLHHYRRRWGHRDGRRRRGRRGRRGGGSLLRGADRIGEGWDVARQQGAHGVLEGP